MLKVYHTKRIPGHFMPVFCTCGQELPLVIAALRRRLDEMKQTVAAKDAPLRQKQREIDQLCDWQQFMAQ